MQETVLDSLEAPAQTSTLAKLTPLMQQYWDIKSAHEDKIVLFRMGDFFEMFHRDAETAAPVLGIALTARNKSGGDTTPMCGVPHHSVANSINKLLAHGFKVAICDQIEDPKFAKGLVKRAVTRILSPGVVYDSDTLDALAPNYLASFDASSVSFLDATTGEAFYFLVKDPARRLRLLRSLQPVEIVLAEREEADAIAADVKAWGAIVSVHCELGPRLAPWPESASRLLGYAIHMRGGSKNGGEKILETIAPFERRELLDRMDLPQMVLRHLEIFQTYKGEVRGTLFESVHRCKTSSGARLLKQWLSFPLANAEAIERRLDRVERWFARPDEIKALRSALGGLGDIQRRLGKLSSPSCHPRDLLALAESLKAGLEVSILAVDVAWSRELIETAQRVAHEILATIVEEPPAQIKNGGIIRRGVRADLDELIDLSMNSHQLIMELEAREREATGIPSLKVRFNNVFGYYIEITHTHKDKVPTDRYERKQTLANAERYLTKELAELESKVLSAQAKRLELENTIFNELVERSLKNARTLQTLAMQWAEVDVVAGLAWLALEQNYCRPRFTTDGSLSLKGSRHPVIEQALPMPFVANDLELPRQGCLLLTGPNMAGKSTLMRQIAISAILAQAGSFVPAQEARLPLFDRVFTRIGASDFLAEGLSTFMVEMKETSEMLENVTEDSLVILDEIGRGTSTYDGMSLAQAILEFILESRRSMTLFATHYHELTGLSTRYPQLFNAHMAIHERMGTQGAEITFLHQLMKGPASKSYGIHVAKLAGLPASVTRRAASILKNLESDRVENSSQMSMLGWLERAQAETHDKSVGENENNFSCLDKQGHENHDFNRFTEGLRPEVQAAFEEMKALDLSRVTPLDALNQIAKWQQSLS
jgi:DNA mismatch repair protein MutS